MAKFWANGVTISLGGQVIGGLKSISLPDQSRGDVDLTDFDSAGDAEFVAGIRDNGNVGLEGLYDPEDAGQQALRADYAGDGVPSAVVITLPTTAGSGPYTVEFVAYVNALGGALAYDGGAEFSAGLRVSGPVTVTNV